MSQPAVKLTELDGALGSLPEGTTKPMCFVGPCDSGPLNLPAAFAQGKYIKANFGGGPTVEAAAWFTDTFGIPAVIVRTGASTPGAYLGAVVDAPGTISAVDNTLVTGTTDFSNNASDPLLTAQWKIVVLTGGTRGTTGIVLVVYRSDDAGATWVQQQIVSMLTNVDFAITGTGISVALSAGTLVAGDVATFSTTAHVNASAGTLVVTGAGTAAITLDASTHPNDDYEIQIRFINGGTRGVDGITYRESRDGGRTETPLKQLGTATSIVVANTGGVKVDIGAGTILAGQKISFPTVAPCWNNTELGTALDALKASAIKKGLIRIVGPIDGTAFDVITTKLPEKKYCWVGNTRMSVGAETEANYFASLAAAFSSRATKNGMLCAGAVRLISQISGLNYRRPAADVIGALQGSVSEEVDIAAVDVGLLKGVSVRDENGNPIVGLHDETANPGLDDARFAVVRTWGDDDESPEGCYTNRPRLFSPEGSDFYLVPHRLVMNIAHAVVTAFFIHRLSKEIVVNKKTGYALESELLEMETGATNALRAALLEKPKASDAYVTLSRTNNLLAKQPLTGDYFVVPLAYPEDVALSGGFSNPANVIKVTS